MTLAQSGIIRRLTAGVGANILDKMVVSAVQLLMVSILSIKWGLQLYGLWVLLSTIPTFLAMGDFGFATAAGVKMTMARARGETKEVTVIFHSAWAAIVLSSILLIIIGVLITMLAPVSAFGTVSGFSEQHLRYTFLLLFLYGVAVVQGSIFFAAFRCDGQFAIGALWNAIIILIESSILLITVWFFGGGPDIAAGALLTGRLLGLSGQNIILRRRIPWLTIGFGRASRVEMLRLLKPAVAVMGVPLAQALALQGSAIMLGLAAGHAAVPAFTAARTLSRIGLQACWLFNSALIPEASAAIGRNDRRSLAMMVFATLALSAVLVLPFAILFAMFGQEAVALWTHDVIQAPATFIAVLSISVVAGGFWFPLSNLLLAANKHGSYTTTYAVLALCSLPITYILCMRFGAIGAAGAMAALDMVMLGVIAFLTAHILVGPGEVLAAALGAFRYLLGFVCGGKPGKWRV